MKLFFFVFVLGFASMLAICAHASYKNETNLDYSANNKNHIKHACTYMMRNGLQRLRKDLSNEEIRTFLSICVEDGHLDTLKGTMNMENKEERIKYNRFGMMLEENNVWYYKEDVNGKQTAWMNLLNKSKLSVSWVMLGFSPTECDTTEKWEVVLRIKLPLLLTGGQQTVLTWDMPEDIKLTDGCLDVLAAGNN